MKPFSRALAAAPLLCTFFWWQNHGLGETRLTLRSDSFPPALDGLRIIHLSDLHNADFGSRLVNCVRRAAPDLIFMTGDLVSRKTKDFTPALRQLSACAAAAPTFYVPGNHERRFRPWKALARELKAAGVTILPNRRVEVTIRGERIAVAGLLDPICGVFNAETVAALCGGKAFPLLLTHRPERFPDYVAGRARLVFCGHAHGGQIRLPGVGGLVAPGQGFFPKYTGGVYRRGRTVMVVSRGLGGIGIPPRLFNRPEVVTVTLRSRLGAGERKGCRYDDVSINHRL